MKKIILALTVVMMMAFSGICMAADGGDLNKEQKVADTFIDAISTDKVAYDKVAVGLNDGLKAKMNEKAFTTLKNNVKTKYGDLKEEKFYSFERYDQQDRVTYITSFSNEKVVALVFVFDKDAKLAEVGFMPMQTQQQNQQADTTAQAAQ